MAFASINIDGQRNYNYKKIEALMEQLSPEDANALTELINDPQISTAKVASIIRGQEANYPDINPELFRVADETVRRYINKFREREVRGL